MDEMQMLQRHFEEVAQPSSDFVGRARNRLLATIEDFRVADAVERKETTTEPSRTRRRRRPHARTFVAGALAVAAVVIALVVSLIVAPGTPGGPAKSAAAELRLFASQAGNVPMLAPGQYFYSDFESPVVSNGVRISPSSTINEYQNSTWQVWVNADGNGRYVRTIDPTVRFYSEADRAAWVAAGSPSSPLPQGFDHSASILSGQGAGAAGIIDASTLPTDAHSLEAVLASGRFNGQLRFPPLCQSEACTVVAGATALLQGPDVGATPALRSALFKVLAEVPGVTNLGNVTDKGGQTGIGLMFSHTTPAYVATYQCVDGALQATSGAGPTVSLQWPASTTSLEFVIDPDTTAVIGTQKITTPDTQSIPNACPGARETQETYFLPPIWVNVLSQGVVDSVTSTP